MATQDDARDGWKDIANEFLRRQIITAERHKAVIEEIDNTELDELHKLEDIPEFKLLLKALQEIAVKKQIMSAQCGPNGCSISPKIF